jgi:hypothetical protein
MGGVAQNRSSQRIFFVRWGGRHYRPIANRAKLNSLKNQPKPPCQPPKTLNPNKPNHIPVAYPPPPTHYNLTRTGCINWLHQSGFEGHGFRACPERSRMGAINEPGRRPYLAAAGRRVARSAQRPNCLLPCHHEPQGRHAKPPPSAQDRRITRTNRILYP